MKTSLTYHLDRGISINDTPINWGMNRLNVRQQLGGIYKESDSVIDMSKYNNGSNEDDIIQRRDIYKNYQGQDNFFFLNYDNKDLLIEVEICHGLDLQIQKVKLDFEMDFYEAVGLLKNISTDYQQTLDGEYLFKDLKLTIANSEARGGDGNLLAYFYCTKNIDHLIEA